MRRQQPGNPSQQQEQPTMTKEEINHVINETVNSGWKYVVDAVLPKVEEYYKHYESRNEEIAKNITMNRQPR